MNTLDILLGHGDHGRLEKLHQKVMEAVKASGVDAKVTKGASSGAMSVHHEPEMRIGDMRIDNADSMTVTGLAKILRMARDGGGAIDGASMVLPFSSRFRATGASADVGDLHVDEIIDDSTGKRYLIDNGTLKTAVEGASA